MNFMKKLLSIILAVSLLLPAFSFSANAAPMVPNTGGGGAALGGSGGINEYIRLSSERWEGLRITIVEVGEVDGTPINPHGCGEFDSQGRPCDLGRVAPGTHSIDISSLSSSASYFSTGFAGDMTTPLKYDGNVVYFGGNRMEYREGNYDVSMLNKQTNGYSYFYVDGMPKIFGNGRDPNEVLENYINDEDMLKKIAEWCELSGGYWRKI